MWVTTRIWFLSQTCLGWIWECLSNEYSIDKTEQYLCSHTQKIVHKNVCWNYRFFKHLVQTNPNAKKIFKLLMVIISFEFTLNSIQIMIQGLRKSRQIKIVSNNGKEWNKKYHECVSKLIYITKNVQLTTRGYIWSIGFSCLSWQYWLEVIYWLREVKEKVYWSIGFSCLSWRLFWLHYIYFVILKLMFLYLPNNFKEI